MSYGNVREKNEGLNDCSIRTYKKLRRAIAAVVLIGTQATNSFAVPAVPGATGFGANSVGGRGGDVYHVTTLANDPDHLIPGSLFYGLYNKNVPGSGTVPGVGRTIVFDVGGTIDLSSGPTIATLDLKDIHNITVAGQTAPSPITIINNTVQITGNTAAKPMHDVIFQHITIRKGTANGADALSIQGTANTHDIFVDHVSGSWSEDEVISATQTSTNVTVQNSIMAEALTTNHAFGSLVRPTVNSQISYNKNLYANQKSRNPRPGTYNGMTLDFEFQNNTIYNWSDRAGYIAGADTDIQHLNMNYAGNYLIAGPMAVDNSGNPARRETAFLKEMNTNPLDIHIFQSGNKIDSNSNTVRDGTDTGWGMFQQLNGGVYSALDVADRNASRFAYPESTPDSADDAYAKAIATAGAMPWMRNAVDTRIINDVLNYTGVAPITAPDATEWNNIVTAPMVSRAAGFDTDADGMPNYWETKRGTNSAVADNNGDVNANGYTNLEDYLNSLSAQVIWYPNSNGNASAYMNWRGDRPTSNYAVTTFGNTITAPRTVTLDIPLTMQDLTFDSTQSYTLAGANALTLDALSGYATLDVNSGSHTISAPVVLADNATVTVANAASTLTLSGNLNATGKTLTKAGAGTMQVQNIRATGLSITGGTFKIIQNGTATGVSDLTNLSISAGTKLDLTDNDLIVRNGNKATIISQINSGQNGFDSNGQTNWSGNGIVSSRARSLNVALGVDVFTVAVIKNADLNSLNGPGSAYTLWDGFTVSANDVLVKFTYVGDTNLDGDITIDDYNAIDGTFLGLTSNYGWVSGDFDLNGSITIDDYNAIDTGYLYKGGQLTQGFVANRTAMFGADYVTHLEQVAAAFASVPEPATAGLLSFATMFLLSRRRKHL